MRVYILTREINDSITNVLGVYKNKEQLAKGEKEIMRYLVDNNEYL